MILKNSTSLLFLILCSQLIIYGQNGVDVKIKSVVMNQEDYFYRDKDKDRIPFLGKVLKVVNDKQQLVIYGFAPSNTEIYPEDFKAKYYYMKDDYYLVKLNRLDNEAFILTDCYLVFQGQGLMGKIKSFLKTASLITIPYKIRPGNDNLKRITTSGIKNVAINFDFMNYRWEAYLANGKIQKWRIAAGGIISPSVEEFENTQSRILLADNGQKQTELFISTGFTLNLSINDLAFSFIPAAWDHGTSTIGKSWNYSNRRWWGFGIGLSPKFLNPASN